MPPTAPASSLDTPSVILSQNTRSPSRPSDSKPSDSITDRSFRSPVLSATPPTRNFHLEVLLSPAEPGQYTSWVDSQTVRSLNLAPSLATVGDAFDNSVIEAIWAHPHIELLSTKERNAHTELAKTNFYWTKISYN